MTYFFPRLSIVGSLMPCFFAHLRAFSWFLNVFGPISSRWPLYDLLVASPSFLFSRVCIFDIPIHPGVLCFGAFSSFWDTFIYSVFLCMYMMCGVDEAGRGPIIGPLVMAAVAISDDSQVPVGVADSKTLSPARREELYEQIILLPHEVAIVSAAEVDVAVEQGGLNWLEADHTVQLLSALQPAEAVLDCPSRNLQAYAEYVRERVPSVEVHAQFKADEEHLCAAAASIVAKVVRDRLVAELREVAGVDFGSGYLTDPKTQAFLHERFDKDFVGWRRSWKPYKKRVMDVTQKRLNL